MHPRLSELVTYIEQERAELRSAVEAVPAGQRSAHPTPGCWSVAEILEHLATVEHGVTRLFEKRLADVRASGIGEETDDSAVLSRIDRSRLLDRTQRISAPDRTRPTGEVNAESAWTALAASRQRFLTVLQTANGLALGEIVHPHPVLGDIDFYEWIAFIGAHENRHTQQVRELADALKGEHAS